MGDDHRRKRMPWWTVFFRYLNDRLVACQWMVLRLCMNCASLFMMKLMFGLVKERYNRVPMTRWNSMASTSGDPLGSYNFILIDNGVATIYAPSMCLLCSKSQAYLYCVRKRPATVGMTSTLRKKCNGCNFFQRIFSNKLAYQILKVATIVSCEYEVINIHKDMCCDAVIIVNKQWAVRYRVGELKVQ